MQPSLPTNLSIEELRIQNQALKQIVVEQRERLEGLERAVKPDRKGLWGRIFGSLAVLVFVVGMAQPLMAFYQTGNSWLGMSELFRGGYVLGAYDAFQVANSWERHDFGWMDECTGTAGSGSWSASQMLAVLDKYYADHPENGNFIAASSLEVALREACP
jgi:hypothetical protein